MSRAIHPRRPGAPGKASIYAIQEPTTGLYAHLVADSARLTYAAHATHFPTQVAAIVAIAGSQISGQPHEVVRLDS